MRPVHLPRAVPLCRHGRMTAVAPVRPATVAELRTLFLFEALEPDRLDRLAAAGTVCRVEAGPVYDEGEPGTHCFVLLSGEIAVSRRSGLQDVELNRTARRGVYVGALHGFYGGPDEGPYLTSLRASAVLYWKTLCGEMESEVERAGRGDAPAEPRQEETASAQVN